MGLVVMSFNWQEPLVALIVGLAVVSLWRHLRGMFNLGGRDNGASCHSCEACDTVDGETERGQQE